jgi:hypothetical protein
MARRGRIEDEEYKPLRSPLTPEGRENQMISLAMDLVERRLREGTASSQETTHFLKLASARERERLERDKLNEEITLLKAKTESIESAKRVEELYSEVLNAIKEYNGFSNDEEIIDE